ncbi:MAG: DUF1579 domain-containing protein [Acidobacteria bacterium]|nr:DUF1579 domain-containing protein [Acidobacteriota bacterium]
MNRCTWTVCRVILCGLIGCCMTLSGATLAAEKKVATPPSAADNEKAMMDAMMKMGTPGAQHEALKKFAGSWKAACKMWMGPGDPQTSEGTSENDVVLGGRFLRESFKGTFMGGPFEGMGFLGYDNLKKKYVSTWIDSLGTMIQDATGQMDKDGKVLTLHGTFTDPLTKKQSPTREVTKFVDDKSIVWEMYGTNENKEVKEMEITYTRK